VKLAEQNKVEEAIVILTQAILQMPKNPSIYNNKAQALRMKGDTENALKDLNSSITLCESHPLVFKNVASQAYTQRGLIKELQGDEEGARLDFEKGASFGNSLAVQEAVKLNPYARLCNQMLVQAMKMEYDKPDQ